MIENQMVTLFRTDLHGKGLSKIGTASAWVYRRTGIKDDDPGVYYDDQFDVRIRENYIADIKAGDIIFFGECSEMPPLDKCRRIGMVSLNRVGLCPHWHIVSEYRYR